MFKKLPRDLQLRAVRRIRLFKADPFYQGLETHKLSGKLSEYWAFSVDFRNRISFKFTDDDIVYFYKIGDHSIYD